MAKFRPHLKNGLIQEGLAKLAKNFYPTCPACPLPPADGTGVAPADSTGVKPFLCYLERSEFIRGKKLTEGTF